VEDSIDNFDAHLADDSPAIDAGTTEGAPTDDFDGHPRDALPDMGAYERREWMTKYRVDLPIILRDYAHSPAPSPAPTSPSGEAIIVDHNATDLSQIPVC
jgi:hypothetical protein